MHPNANKNDVNRTKNNLMHENKHDSWDISIVKCGKNAPKQHHKNTTCFFFQLKICGILLICFNFSFFKLYFWATFSQILFSCNFFDIALLHLQPMCHDYSYSFNCETIENNQPADRHIGGPADFPVSHNLCAHIWQFNFLSSFSFICKKLSHLKLSVYTSYFSLMQMCWRCHILYVCIVYVYV